jgi:hypothetical protein
MRGREAAGSQVIVSRECCGRPDWPESDRRPPQKWLSPPGAMRTTLPPRDPAVHRPFGLFFRRCRPTRVGPGGRIQRSGQGRAERERGLSQSHLAARTGEVWQLDLGRKPLVFSAGSVLQGTPRLSATEVTERFAIKRRSRAELPARTRLGGTCGGLILGDERRTAYGT